MKLEKNLNKILQFYLNIIIYLNTGEHSEKFQIT